MSSAIADQSRRAAHRASSVNSIAEIATYVQSVLGPSLTALTLGIKDIKAVGQWAKSQRSPRRAQEEALRATFQVVSYLASVENNDVIRAWFTGMNPDLDDRSPALTMRESPLAVIKAADAFIHNA